MKHPLADCDLWHKRYTKSGRIAGYIKTEVIEHVRWDESAVHYWPHCIAVDVVPLRRRPDFNKCAPQRQYRDAVVRNWFKVWCAFKLLALAQRARKRAYEPGGSGARAAQANFERAAKRQRS